MHVCNLTTVKTLSIEYLHEDQVKQSRMIFEKFDQIGNNYLGFQLKGFTINVYTDTLSYIGTLELSFLFFYILMSIVIFCYSGHPLKLHFQIPSVFPVYSLSDHTFSLCQSM